MKKNVGSQVIGVQMVSATDGSAFTGTATVVITGDGGTQGASGGTGPTHEGNGYHTYIPTQAETNYDLIGFTFTGSGAVPVTVQVFTTFPQTADAPTAAAIRTEMDSNSTQLAAIVADTNELQTDDVPGLIAALNNVAATDIVSGGAITTTGGAVSTVTNITQIAGSGTAALNVAGVFDTQFATAYNSTNGNWNVDIARVSGDQTAAMNLEAAFDGTGYAFTGCSVPSVGSVTGAVDSVNGNVGGNVVGSVGSISGVTFPTNFADMAITVTTGYVTVGGYLGAALTETTGGRIAGNFDTFFENADAATSKTVNDVGVAGSGLTAQQVWEYVTRTLTSSAAASSDLLQSTTIATLASQKEFTLTAGSADSDAYEGALVIVTDSATSTQKAVSRVLNYTGSTKTVELVIDPNIFTMAVGDTVDIIATDATVSPGAGGSVGWLG